MPDDPTTDPAIDSGPTCLYMFTYMNAPRPTIVSEFTTTDWRQTDTERAAAKKAKRARNRAAKKANKRLSAMRRQGRI